MIYKNIIDDNQVQEAVKLLLNDAEQTNKKDPNLDYDYLLAKK